MRLRYINEMFDNVSLDDDITILGNGVDQQYEKLIDGQPYRVVIREVGMELVDDTENPEAITTMLDTVGGIWRVSLRGPNDFKATGKGNFAAVYGFLLACLQDMIVNYGVNALAFRGAQPGMDIVYDRMIKSLRKSDNPAIRFFNVDESIWLSERGMAMLDDDTANVLKNQNHESDKDRAANLKSIRVRKINQKKYGHLLGKQVDYHGVPYTIQWLGSSGVGVAGYPHTVNADGSESIIQFTPNMINQLKELS